MEMNNLADSGGSNMEEENAAHQRAEVGAFPGEESRWLRMESWIQT